MTQEHLVSKVERLRRELEILYRGETGWDTVAIDRVTDDLAEAEFALAGETSSYLQTVGAH